MWGSTSCIRVNLRYWDGCLLEVRMYHFVWIGDCHSFLQRMVNTGWVLKWNLRLILCPGFLSNFLILIFAPYTMGVIYSYHGNSLPAMRIAFTYYTFVWQYKRKFSASLKYHDLRARLRDNICSKWKKKNRIFFILVWRVCIDSSLGSNWTNHSLIRYYILGEKSHLGHISVSALLIHLIWHLICSKSPILSSDYPTVLCTFVNLGLFPPLSSELPN